ncbi:hypothetical protein B9Z19DRAFT_1123070 [Tuber borchii]|uniref:Uncharacterized protein n=1 Tax=Tuber borchii TaxID=42251 RepID=A0A2T6ZZ10_TUBBO|nr:hypothetical protein B9Z19DRAFT_1123070 [Tuber borchii]
MTIFNSPTDSTEGGSLCQIFLVNWQGFWKVLTLKLDSGGVRYANVKPFTASVLRHPICQLPKERSHTSIFHRTTESSEWGSVGQAITGPFNDGVLHHLICQQSKGRPHMSILYGTTESSEAGILGALGMRSQTPLTTAFYASPSVHRQKDVPIREFSMIPGALSMRSWSPFKRLFYVFLSVHRQKEIPGALGMRSRSPLTTAFYAIPSVNCQEGVPIRVFSMGLQSLLKGESLCWVFLDV